MKLLLRNFKGSVFVPKEHMMLISFDEAVLPGFPSLNVTLA
jgi:hypothetical protein